MNLRSEIINKHTVIYLQGRMDIDYLNAIEDSYDKVISEVNTEFLIIDLSKVVFISSSALRIFITTLKHCKDNRIHLKLCSLHSAVKKVFELVEMSSMFDIYDNLKNAIVQKK